MAGLENPVEELIVENKQMSEAFCNSLFLALSGGISGCLYLQFKRQGVFKRTDWQCGTDEPAFYGGTLAGKESVICCHCWHLRWECLLQRGYSIGTDMQNVCIGDRAFC